MKWVAADFYRLDRDNLVCTLCPHVCSLGDGEIGVCRVRRRSGERMETATFATTVRHLDPVERKPFYHFRPGTHALTLAAPGCSFACLYCQNYRVSQFGRVAEISWNATAVDPHELISEAVDQSAAIALSYSEPTLAAELTLALVAADPHRLVPILWKTNGFITREALARLAPCLSAVNVDLKAADNAKHQALTGAPLSPVLEAISGFIAAGVWVEVSTPVIPGVNADAQSLRRMAEAIGQIDPRIPWHLLRFSPEFRMHNAKPTHPDTLIEAVEIAKSAGLQYIYVERALGEPGRNTLCPNCRFEVVSREIWGTRRVELVDGACPRCDAPIPGRW